MTMSNILPMKFKWYYVVKLSLAIVCSLLKIRDFCFKGQLRVQSYKSTLSLSKFHVIHEHPLELLHSNLLTNSRHSRLY